MTHPKTVMEPWLQEMSNALDRSFAPIEAIDRRKAEEAAQLRADVIAVLEEK